MKVKKLNLVLLLCLSAFNSIADGVANFEIVVDGRTLNRIEDIDGALKDGSTIYLGPGIYTTGFHIRKNRVKVVGDDTYFKNAAIEGKAAIVVSGSDVVIEGIECSHVEVRDKNGACVRQQGKNLTLVDVYFHDSEQGVLQSPGTGGLKVIFSRFERLGKDGYAHAIYSNGNILDIADSVFLGTKDQGHSIKSRSESTYIKNTVISSADGNDSRLIDIPNGGFLSIENTVLHQGINSVNGQLIGYGLETIDHQRNHEVRFYGNIIVAERPNGNTFFYFNKDDLLDVIDITGSVFIGRYKDRRAIPSKNNIFFDSRREAKLKPEELPDIHYLRLVWNGLIK